MGNEKIKREKKEKYNMRQNIWFMVKLAWAYKEKKVLVLGLLSALTAVMLNLVNLFVPPMILAAVERHASISELILTVLCFVLALMFFSALLAYINENIIYGRITLRSTLIALLNKKVMTMSYPNVFDERFKRVRMKAVEAVRTNHEATEAIWITLTEFIQNSLCFIIYVLLLTSVQPLLMLVILLTTLLSYFARSYANEWRYRHREKEAEYEKQMYYLNGLASDLTAAKDIRIFGLRPWIEELYQKVMASYVLFQKHVQRSYFWVNILDLMLTFVRNATAYAYLIKLVIDGGLDVATFLLLFNTVSGFTGQVTSILNGLNQLHKQSLDISNVRECLEYPELFKFEDGEKLGSEDGKTYEIVLENVSFKYPGAEKETLSNINLTLHSGEKLAVVGLNGAGKTTLVKLICGFLDPTKGRVLLNGKDIRDYNRADYYTMVAAVFQDFSLLAGTLATNVAQDCENIDMERVKKCMAQAGLSQMVAGLTDGYETYLNHEVFETAIMLSGGQIQRLMLARALYKEAPFIVLDEPTAALDPIAESDIYQKYNEMTEGKSSIFISHRLASTRFCDRIILIDHGTIAEMGSHEDLVKREGQYAEIYAMQSKYYKEGKAV